VNRVVAAEAAAPVCGLTAEAGGPYEVTRAAAIVLNGSASTGSRPITKYQWTFSPGADCPRGNLTNSTLTTTDPTVQVVPLCGLSLALRVTDADGHTADDTATLKIDPRRQGSFQATKVELSDGSVSDGRTPKMQLTTAGFTLGANVSTCRTDALSPPLCPPVDKPLDGQAYETHTVDDPGGPFDKFEYVWVNHVRVPQVALFNVHLFPGSIRTYPDPAHPRKRITWLGLNLREGEPVAGLKRAVRQHEGWGKGGSPADPKASGHAGASQLAMTRNPDENDPAFVLEKIFAPTKSDVVRKADAELRRIDKLISDAAKDPRPTIWAKRLQFWDRASRTWQRCLVRIGPKNAPLDC
jgi:hypothetical protein